MVVNGYYRVRDSLEHVSITNHAVHRYAFVSAALLYDEPSGNCVRQG